MIDQFVEENVLVGAGEEMIKNEKRAANGLRDQNLLLFRRVEPEFVCSVDTHCFSPRYKFPGIQI